MTLTVPQAAALEHLRKAYFGPEEGEREVVLNRPSLQYTVGMLFPPDQTESARDDVADEFVSADVGDGDLEEDDAGLPLAEDWRPSSVAISFVIDIPAVACDFTAGTYKKLVDDGPRRWIRSPHAFTAIELSRGLGSHRQLDVGGLKVEIGSRWRPFGDAWLVTVHVRLGEKSTGSDRDDIDRMLFQVGLVVRPAAEGAFCEYDVSRGIDTDAEARELGLRYRERKTFGVGHGMAAGWDVEDNVCTRVYLDSVPYFVVPAVEQALGDAFRLTGLAKQSMEFKFLESIEDDPTKVTAALAEFTDSFELWASTQRAAAGSLGGDAEAIARRAAEAARRMRSGVELLAAESSGQLRTAFSLGMKAMRLQMEQSELANGVSDPNPRWRPFQLGFLLVSIASSIDEAHPDRDVVDLIWFPTGGGKTEAYLGLAAIVIFLRRLRFGEEGGGTAVITRYTLRLLTSQQFQRAAALICAMELVRVGDARARGMVRFSIGLWVGNDATPGSRGNAKTALERLYKARDPKDANEFQITECPWCLANLVPDRRDESRRTYGAQREGNDVVFRCVSESCEFSSRELPMSVVDDVLYDEPPTFLLATVDKFARLQFKRRAGRLLGIGTAYMQPSLIIQDELHLLAGPLGTTVAVFDAVIQLLLNRTGSQPKVVASTATIRASGEQVRGLYGRAVALYPPAGVNGDETFFARPIASGEGRLYVGLMPQSVSQATALVAAASPLIEIPEVVRSLGGIDGRLDPYWTTVMYHNSLRELGRTGPLLLDDINGRLETRSERLGTVLRTSRAASVIELTSRRSPEELSKVLRRLRLSVDESADAVDVVLSSNMLSVGIDVQRLALMLMVGQPKTTAEYIQATSRVGRGKISGIVVTLFRSNRARDRSHFETFRGYHNALYRSVEPTSVTPWSLSSRDRSLAGALVMLVRHSFSQLADDEGAGRFDLSETGFRAGLEKIIDQLLSIVVRADSSERDEVADQIWELLRGWDQAAATARREGVMLWYERNSNADVALLKRFGQQGPGWLVGDSMRSVEPNVAVEVEEPLREVGHAKDKA